MISTIIILIIICCITLIASAATFQLIYLILFIISTSFLVICCKKQKENEKKELEEIKNRIENIKHIQTNTDEINKNLNTTNSIQNEYIKKTLITKCEDKYYSTLKEILNHKYIIQPQICLSSIIEKKNEQKYANELYRIIDFGIFDKDYNILILLEINDITHNKYIRKERDLKIKTICNKANIPIISLWTKYGINKDYIKKRLQEYITIE